MRYSLAVFFAILTFPLMFVGGLARLLSYSFMYGWEEAERFFYLD